MCERAFRQVAWFPPGLESMEKREGIFQSGKSQGILPKILENQEKLYWKIEKNTGKVREICQPVIVKTLLIWYHTLNNKKAVGLVAQLMKLCQQHLSHLRRCFCFSS